MTPAEKTLNYLNDILSKNISDHERVLNEITDVVAGWKQSTEKPKDESVEIPDFVPDNIKDIAIEDILHQLSGVTNEDLLKAIMHSRFPLGFVGVGILDFVNMNVKLQGYCGQVRECADDATKDALIDILSDDAVKRVSTFKQERIQKRG